MNKYVLTWGDGDGYSFHEYHTETFETDNIDEWEFNFFKKINEAKNNDEYCLKWKNLTLPINSKEFSYKILTLDEWFLKNLIE